MDDFPDFGAWPHSQTTPAPDWFAPSLATAQPYESLVLPWSSSLDAFHFSPDLCYDGMLSSEHMLSESHVDWSNYQTSTRQFEGHGVSDSDATGYHARSQMNTVGSQTSHDESSIDTGARYPDPVTETINFMPAPFTPQQSSYKPIGRKCVIVSCEFHYTSQWQCKEHMRAVHQDAFTCEECMYVGKSQYELGLHASNTGHASFICKHDGCEKKFSRLDTYQRHQRTHREDAKRFPCKYCKKYRAKSAFKRKDHLTQHVRNYHHIGEGEQVGHMDDRKWCPKKDCTKAIPAWTRYHDPSTQGAFPTSKEWITHMRDVHDESEFSCPQPGCDRIDGKGYFREADLRAHLRKIHGTDGSFDRSIQHKLWK